MKKDYQNSLALMTAARAALSRAGYERLMLDTNYAPTAEQVCHAVEREIAIESPSPETPNS